MSKDEQLEMLIIQALNAAVSAAPSYLQDVDANKDQLLINDSKEFVYGMVIGMTFGLGSVLFTNEMPTYEEQSKIREIIYKNMPEIRKKIFND